MSVASIDRPDAMSDAGDFSLSRLSRDEPVWTATALALLALALPSAFAALVDPRLTNDIAVWTKPLKFQVSLAVYLLTLAFFARYLPTGVTSTRWYRFYALAVAAAIGLEVAWVMGAAILGTPAHFNQSAAGEAIYMLMGALATLLTSASAVYAFQIARNGETGLSPAVKSGIVWGLALTLPLTLVTAGTMSSFEGHWVGGMRSDSAGLAVFGWARDGGDLRVAHFFSTHAMHFLPVFGLASAAVFGASRRLPVRVAAVAFVLFVSAVFAQALMGRPFLPMLG